MNRILFIALLSSCSCPGPGPNPNLEPTPTLNGTQVTLTSAQAATVYLTFGADSAIQAANWASFCTVTTPLACNFALGTTSQLLPNPTGQYLNMTLAFNAPVGCNATKAEVNVNNPTWYDTMDVSLVDGYSNAITINYTPPGGTLTTLGPPVGQTGNEKVLGVYPYGCDLCTDNSVGTCGIPQGTAGCKGGTQYKPDVPCQYQGAVMGGGGTVNVILQ